MDNQDQVGSYQMGWEVYVWVIYYHIKNKSPIIKEAESPREGITVNRCGPEGQ